MELPVVDTEPTLPLAPEGVFATVQGEGALIGLPSAFIRLAGCSVGCPQCDTNYTVASRLTMSAIVDRVTQLVYGGTEWVWITGGEPTDHDLLPLVVALRALPVKIAVATAGLRHVQMGWANRGGVDFMSVSPHDLSRWQVRRGDQVNIVPGLNGLRLDEWREALLACQRDFSHRYVTPLYGDAASYRECLEWVRCNAGWRLGTQAHKTWGLP